MWHFDIKPYGLYYTLITIKIIFNLAHLRSNCCSINSWVGRCCMTYGLAVWVPYLLCWGKALIWLCFSAKGGRRKGRLKVGLYWTFCLCGELWAGSLCESRDFSAAKSNQMFWGLTGPISQWLVAAYCTGSVFWFYSCRRETLVKKILDKDKGWNWKECFSYSSTFLMASFFIAS